MIVDGGVVDDFVGDPQPLAWVMASRLVGHRDGPFDAPAEAKRFGQVNIEASMGELVAVIANRADEPALIGLLKVFGHFFGSPEPAPVVSL